MPGFSNTQVGPGLSGAQVAQMGWCSGVKVVLSDNRLREQVRMGEGGPVSGSQHRATRNQALPSFYKPLGESQSGPSSELPGSENGRWKEQPGLQSEFIF